MIGKSKKAGKKKRKQLVATDISSANLLENRGDDAEDEVYEMSSGDEDYSKGMKSMILVLLISLIHFIFAYLFTLLSGKYHEAQPF